MKSGAATAQPVEHEQRSPARQALADAQLAVLTAEQAAVAGRRAIERAVAMVSEAEARLKAAQTQVSGARKRHVELLSDAATRGEAVPTGTMREAKLAASDAEDELAAAREALAHLRARQPELDDDAHDARSRVIVCVDAVVRERAEQALAEAEDALAALLAKRRVLSFMLRPHGTGADPLAVDPTERRDWHDWVQGRERVMERERAQARRAWALQRERDGMFAELGEHIKRHLRNGLEANPDWREHPDTAPWRAARAALFSDPDAPLPE
jgi:predicted  nucleic acid-binding Zn-ribbon protein